MPTHITHLTLPIAPDRQAEFEAMMQVEAPLTRAFEGCELFEVYARPEAGEIVFLGHWRSQAASEAYPRWRAERGDMDRLGAFFVAPSRRAVLRLVVD